MLDETDAKRILTAPPIENWRRQPESPPMDEDYPSGPEVQ